MSFLELLNNKLSTQTAEIEKKSLRDLPDPSTLRNNFIAAERIIENLSNSKRLLIVGDYDCDGIMATTILFSFLRDVGYSEFLVDYIIPSRLKDGYGVSKNIIDYAIENMFDFIVTVDNGVAAVEAIDYANENGIEVIVTDHHTAPEVLPNAYTIVNPRVPGETFPFPWISGATVAWYLTAALKRVLGVETDIAQYLDYAAITVVSDVMPMDNINMALLKYGLKEIKQRKRLFYQLIWNDWRAPTIDETSLGFDLVPRINAIGRINDANLGVRMFTTRDNNEFKEYFEQVTQINEDRKAMSRELVKEAEGLLDSVNGIETDKLIIVRDETFHEGIVGIIAGKLAERHQKPAYVLSYNEEKGIWKGSARSVGEVHLYDLTSQATEYILGFGGHKGAVGLAVEEKNWDKFVSKLSEAAGALDPELFVDENKLPVECDLEDMSLAIFDVLEKHGPYGNGNPKPEFRSKGFVKIERELKDGLHMKTVLIHNGFTIPGLFFNVEKEDFIERIESGEQEFIFQPSKSYNPKTGVFSIELLCTLI